MARRDYRSLSADRTLEHLKVIDDEMATLSRTIRWLHHRYTDSLATYLIVRALGEKEPLSINGLATELGIDPTTVTRQVAGLLAAGVVDRSVDGNDARVRLLSLSAKGRAKLVAIRAHRLESTKQLLADWDDDELATFATLFMKFNRAIAAYNRREIEAEDAS